MLFDTIAMQGTYETRKVENTELTNGLIVSTAFTTDEGYETAIFSSILEVAPVERYSTREEAVEGHKKWVVFAEEGIGKKVVMLGCYEDDWETSTVFLNA